MSHVMATATPVIREATHVDLPAVVAMGLRFLDASTYRDQIAVNPEAMYALAERLIAAESHAALLVAEQDDVLVGMLGLLAYHHHISGEWIAGEVFWWLNEDARGLTGIRMLRAAERWTRAQGAGALQVGAPVSSPRVKQLYQRLGFQEVETTYQRRLT